MWKQIFFLGAMILMINSFVIAQKDFVSPLTDKIINDSKLISQFGTSNSTMIKSILFKELKLNDAYNKEAVFLFNGIKVSKESNLSISFKEVCGKVNSYDLVIPKTCVEKIESCVMEKNGTKNVCKNFDRNYSCDESLTNISKLTDIKITNVNITPGNCLINNVYYQYIIDWQPAIDLEGNIFVDDRWDWWNATGGTIKTIIDINDGLNYTVHTFTSNGTFNTTGTGSNTNAQILIIAGGGAGGAGHNSAGGGAGAGGLIYNSSVTLADSTSYNVVVGTGGIPKTIGATDGNSGNGTNSSFGSFPNLVAKGGGSGAYGWSTTWYAGSGGSGGGDLGTLNGSGTTNQGYGGGIGNYAGSHSPSGGGGGAGAVGASAVSGTPGNGGKGLNYSINGTNMNYSGGGGGSTDYNGALYGTGGNGGGGNGGLTNNNGSNGVNGLGGGGGAGGGWEHVQTGGYGGSGVVIIRYLTSVSSPDNNPPIVSSVLPTNNNLTNIHTPIFKFNFTDNVSSTANCILYINETNKGSNSSTANNTLTSITSSVLTDGSYTWHINCTDGGGNIGTSSNLNINITTENLAIKWSSPTIDSNHTTNAFQQYCVNITCNNYNCGDVNASIDPTTTWVKVNSTTIGSKWWDTFIYNDGGVVWDGSEYWIGNMVTWGRLYFHINLTDYITNNNVSSINDIELTIQLCNDPETYGVSNIYADNGWITESGLTTVKAPCGNVSGSLNASCNNISFTHVTAGISNAYTWNTINLTSIYNSTDKTLRFVFWNESASNNNVWTKEDITGNIPYLNMSVTYNSGSVTTKGLINTTVGATPFYTNDSNPVTVNLDKDETNQVCWWVNATGSVSSVYGFYVFTNITSTMTINNVTAIINITIVNATAAPAVNNSCNYSGSGTWYVNISFMCNFTSTNLFRNVIIFNDTGRVTGLRNLFNYSRMDFSQVRNGWLIS